MFSFYVGVSVILIPPILHFSRSFNLKYRSQTYLEVSIRSLLPFLAHCLWWATGEHAGKVE